MKKIFAAFAALFMAFAFAPQASANDQKALVIIDSYFDSRAGVEVVCLATDACKSVVTSIPSSSADNANHGVAMVEIAKKNIGSGKIIALRMSTATSRTAANVTGADFIRALEWVEKNSSNIAAVSFSRSISGNMPKIGDCKIAPTGLTISVPVADSIVRTKIANLKTLGIPVFVSTGNSSKSPVNYPACITDTMSVATGAQSASGATVSSHTWDANTDHFVNPSPSVYKSQLFNMLPMTTSPATAALAAKWVSTKNIVKFDTVLS